MSLLVSSIDVQRTSGKSGFVGVIYEEVESHAPA